MVNLAQSITSGGHAQRCGQVVAVLIGCAVMFRIQPMHGIARLLIERMVRVRRVIQSNRG